MPCAPTMLWLAMAMMMISSIQAALPSRLAGECVSFSVSSSTDAFPSAFQVISAPQETFIAPTYTTITFAQGFNVTYYAGYKLVTNMLTYPTPTSYALYQCGMTPPSASELPANTELFQIPLTSVAVEDTTIIAFLNLLGLLGRVSYVTQYAVNPCMQSLGYYGCKRLTSGSANNYTDVVTSNVDGILGYQSSNETIAVDATADPGPLNRAEWIKFVATFFNKEDVANAVFTGIAQRYNATKAAVAAQNAATKPLVAWIIFEPAGYGSPDQVQISFAQYKINYVQDAGGSTLNLTQANATAVQYGVWGTDVTYQYSSLILRYASANLTQMLRSVLADVDILIDETRFPNITNSNVQLTDVLNLYGFQGSDIQALKFIKNNKIIREDAQTNPDGYTAWFEQAVAQPDVVLQDLAYLVTPAAVSSSYTLQFLRILGKQQPILLSTASCPLLNCQISTGAGIDNTAICPLIFQNCSGAIVAATATQRCAPNCTQSSSPSPPTVATQAGHVIHPTWVGSLWAVACSVAALLAMLV